MPRLYVFLPLFFNHYGILVHNNCVHYGNQICVPNGMPWHLLPIFLPFIGFTGIFNLCLGHHYSMVNKRVLVNLTSLDLTHACSLHQLPCVDNLTWWCYMFFDKVLCCLLLILGKHLLLCAKQTVCISGTNGVEQYVVQWLERWAKNGEKWFQVPTEPWSSDQPTSDEWANMSATLNSLGGRGGIL